MDEKLKIACSLLACAMSNKEAVIRYESRNCLYKETWRAFAKQSSLRRRLEGSKK